MKGDVPAAWNLYFDVHREFRFPEASISQPLRDFDAIGVASGLVIHDAGNELDDCLTVFPYELAHAPR